MRKYKLLIVALILGMVCMLCGCVPGVSLDIECNGLEEGERVFVLVKPTDEDNLRVLEDADLTGSELGVWEAVAPYNWAVCPKGTVFPYFCCVMKGDGMIP